MQPGGEAPASVSAIANTLTGVRTESGAELFALSHESPVLLVFLRHFGCSFCRKAISDVAELIPQLSSRGVRPVFVHLGTPEIAQAHFAYYGIPEVDRIHDPEAHLYREFGLGRQNPARSLINPAVLWSWFIRGDLFRHGIGRIETDGHQMPGVFLLRDGKIARGFRHRNISDQPDYLKLIA
jgi:peroxiredoxin